MRQKVMYGEALCKATFGYVNINKSDSHNHRKPLDQRSYATMVIVPEQVKIIKEAFELYANHDYSVREVHRILTTKYNLNLSSSSFHILLTNQFYIGTMNIKGKDYKHCYETIIEPSLFFKTQQILASSYHKKNLKTVFYYRGLITCGVCGLNITGISATKRRANGSRFVYYKCSENSGKHDAKYVRQEEIKRQIANELLNLSKKFYDSPKEFIGMKNCVRKIHESFVAKPQDFVKVLQTIFNSITIKDSRLSFTYSRTFDIINEDVFYLYYRLIRAKEGHLDSARYLQDINEMLDAIVNLEDIPVKKNHHQDLGNTNDLLTVIKKPMHINDILSKMGSSLDSLQQELISLQIEGIVDEVSPGVWVAI